MFYSKLKLVVLIPAYNEARAISDVIKKVPKSIEGVNEIGILVINDGSTDDTAKIARESEAMVFSHPVNEGLGKTFTDGINQALKLKADIIVSIDADNQFDSSEIPKLIEPILRSRADMVTGTRFKNGQKIPNMSGLKRLGNKFFVRLINILTGKNFSDTACGFRAYSREAALNLNLFGGFTYTQEVLLDLVGKEKKIEEVPVSVKYYSDRNSKISGSLFSYGVQALMIVLKTFRDYFPLKFFGIPGLAIFSVGATSVLYSLIFYLVNRYTTPIRMVLFSGSALLIFGLLLVILALVADMLKRIRRNQEEILYRLKKDECEQKY